MKKKYSKPMLFAETFELVEHIAACEGDLAYQTHHDQGKCAVTLSGKDGSGGTIFTASITDCLTGQVYNPADDPSGELLAILLNQSKCYNTFNAGTMYSS